MPLTSMNLQISGLVSSLVPAIIQKQEHPMSVGHQTQISTHLGQILCISIERLVFFFGEI